eukprot:1161240-Pelagomonas_calceolata.AAC.8
MKYFVFLFCACCLSFPPVPLAFCPSAPALSRCAALVGGYGDVTLPYLTCPGTADLLLQLSCPCRQSCMPTSQQAELVNTRCAIENKNTLRSQVMEPGASNNPSDPHKDILFVVFVVEGIQAFSEPMCPLFLN